MNRHELKQLLGKSFGNVATTYREKSADLTIQAMLFDMEVDIETLNLMPKVASADSVWLTRWKEKRANSDFNELMDIDWR